MRGQPSELERRLAVVFDLRAAAAVLGWDQETYMPTGAVEARANQLATLGRLAHEMFTSDTTADLLAAYEQRVAGSDYDSDEASLARVTRRDYERAVKVPAELVAELARASSLAQQAWQEARAAADFDKFQPHLEKLIELALRKAEAIGYADHVYDALLDEYEPGMTKAEIETLFGRLRDALVPIVQAIASVGREEFAFLSRSFEDQTQWDFGIGVLGDFGFDFCRGRQDRSAHPFTTAFSVNDVRVTTRIHEDSLPSGLFSTMHECGHALYEQGVSDRLERTLLADGASLGVHESQSRLWEILVGRSREFWSHYFDRLRDQFGAQLADVDAEQFYRAINQVRPSLIRVEADEVTYNLHIMLRFELEVALLEGRLAVADLPEAWNDKMVEYLGLRPDNDGDGVLQDIHWSMAAIGYFPTYTLGNLMSVQLFDRAKLELPDLLDQIASGHFLELLEWLREHIHQHGRKFTAQELLRRATGSELSADPWVDYVRNKYSDLMGVEL